MGPFPHLARLRSNALEAEVPVTVLAFFRRQYSGGGVFSNSQCSNLWMFLSNERQRLFSD